MTSTRAVPGMTSRTLAWIVAFAAAAANAQAPRPSVPKPGLPAQLPSVVAPKADAGPISTRAPALKMSVSGPIPEAAAAPKPVEARSEALRLGVAGAYTIPDTPPPPPAVEARAPKISLTATGAIP